MAAAKIGVGLVIMLAKGRVVFIFGLARSAMVNLVLAAAAAVAPAESAVSWFGLVESMNGRKSSVRWLRRHFARRLENQT